MCNLSVSCIATFPFYKSCLFTATFPFCVTFSNTETFSFCEYFLFTAFFHCCKIFLFTTTFIFFAIFLFTFLVFSSVSRYDADNYSNFHVVFFPAHSYFSSMLCNPLLRIYYFVCCSKLLSTLHRHLSSMLCNIRVVSPLTRHVFVLCVVISLSWYQDRGIHG